MKIGIVGLGAAGLPFAVNLAEKHKIIGVDIDRKVVESINKKEYHGIEPGIDLAIKKADIYATTNLDDINVTDAVFLTLPSTDSNFSELEKTISRLDEFYNKDVIISTTSPPGFTRQIQEYTPKMIISYVPIRTFEGEALRQFYQFPHIIGTFNNEAYNRVSKIFRELGCETISAIPPEKAELAKLMSNSFRQAQMAIANEFAFICESYEQDPKEVFKIANDRDPNRDIKNPGPWGGYCLPKDTKMLINSAGCTASLLRATEKIRQEVNERKAESLYRLSKGKTIGIEGIANKPVEARIPDTRQSPILEIIDLLKSKGASVKIYDPNLSDEQLKRISSEYDVKIAKSREELMHCKVYARYEAYDLRLIKK